MFISGIIFPLQQLRAQQRKTSSSKTVKQLTADELHQKGDDCFFGENGEFMNKDKAKDYWMQAAAKGHACSQYALVVNHMVDGEEAMRMLRNSAEQKYPPSMNLMSRCYHEKGNYDWFPDADDEQSLYWARLSAEAGDPEGQYLYGGHFYNGNGVPKNYEEAEKWLSAAGEKGYLEAMKNLAKAYQMGWFGFTDTDKAFYWWHKAAETGDPESQYRYGDVVFNKGDGVEYEKEAYVWFKKAAEQNYVEAFADMGMYNELGWGGMDVNLKEALAWYRRGFRQQDGLCSWLLYEIGEVHSNLVHSNLVNNQERIDALKCAAEKGVRDARAQLGLHHYTGLVDKPDLSQGLPVIRELAINGESPRAMAIYGNMMMSGMPGVKKDKKSGAEYIRRAAQKGDHLAIELAKEKNIQY